MIWPFRRPQPRVRLDGTPAYSRWLRAQRPPWEWFMSLDADEQKHVADLGDEHILYTADLVSGEPESTTAPIAQRMEQMPDEGIDRSTVEEMARRIIERRSSPTAAGLGERKGQQRQESQSHRSRSPSSVLGREPDQEADPEPVKIRRPVTTAAEAEDRRR